MKYTNYTLRIPVFDTVGQDVDFWMKKPCTIEALRKALRKALKENLSIDEVSNVELDDLIKNWGVWDELKVMVKQEEGEPKEARFGSYIDKHIENFEAAAVALLEEDKEAIPTMAGTIMFAPEQEARIGSLKARMGVGDITSE